MRDIGSKAGLGLENTNILSGAVGVPESRLEACPPLPLSLSLFVALPRWARKWHYIAGCCHQRRSLPVSRSMSSCNAIYKT